MARKEGYIDETADADAAVHEVFYKTMVECCRTLGVDVPADAKQRLGTLVPADQSAERIATMCLGGLWLLRAGRFPLLLPVPGPGESGGNEAPGRGTVLGAGERLVGPAETRGCERVKRPCLFFFFQL